MSTEFSTDKSSLRVDLHSHTKCSDGSLTPEELIERAVGYQIDMLAITDHDTTEAFNIASSYIKDKNYPIKLVSGVEISTGWHGFEIHVVGLNIDINNPQLCELIAAQQQVRERRARMMAEKLAKCGFDNMYDKAKKLAGSAALTRTHFAKVLLNEGSVNTMQAAFDKYIGKGKRAYIKPMWTDIENACAVIEQAGGHSVLAHPIRYDLSAKWRRRLIVEFKLWGGDALEVALPQMNQQQRQQMVSYCQEYDLLASAGSDFHAPSRWSDLGRNLNLPDNCKPVWQQWR